MCKVSLKGKIIVENFLHKFKSYPQTVPDSEANTKISIKNSSINYT